MSDLHLDRTALPSVKRRAIYRIARHWGIPNPVKMQMIDRVLETNDFGEIDRIKKYAKGLSIAIGTLVSAEIDYGVKMLTEVHNDGKTD